jgi:S-DNA-T family DNA segregation ATPase FtsK/SpoIIIE
MASALMVLVSLVSHSPDDPVWYFKETSRQATENLIGPIGAFISEAFLQLLGLASYLLAVLLAAVGWSLFWCRSIKSSPTKIVGLISVTVSLAGLLSLSFGELPHKGELFPAGGAVGHLFAAYLSSALNHAGAFILLVTMLFTSLVVTTSWSISRGAQRFGAWQRSKTAELMTAFHHFRESRRKEKLRRRVVKKHAKRALEAKKKKDKAREGTDKKDAAAVKVDRKEAQKKQTEQEMLPFTPKKGKWTMPPSSILDSRKEEVKLNDKELMERAKTLQLRCREFAVEGQVLQIHPGPLVTTFEFKPDAGIKYSRITALADDLCLALKSESVRIDRISGKSAVGIEIPNEQREIVGLREVVESDAFGTSSSRLTMALGKTIDGAPFVTDLTRMPHLLIAGATGSGKSVLLNSLICSVLFKSTPDEVTFILVDPKRVELGA